MTDRLVVKFLATTSHPTVIWEKLENCHFSDWGSIPVSGGALNA